MMIIECFQIGYDQGKSQYGTVSPIPLLETCSFFSNLGLHKMKMPFTYFFATLSLKIGVMNN